MVNVLPGQPTGMCGCTADATPLGYVADGAFDSGFADLLDTLRETFVHTFNVAGTFEYFCGVHTAQMTGTVTVLP